MTKTIWIIVAFLLVVGACIATIYFWPRPAKADTSLGITFEDERPDQPEFRRTYSARLDSRATIKINARTRWGNDRTLYGELTQPNGSGVFFDPDRIADKILDPLLVPIVEKYCQEIKRMDEDFISSKPKEFTDKNGTTWKRATPQ